MIWISYRMLGIIFIIIILFALGGAHLVLSHLYNIILTFTILLGISFLIAELIRSLTEKKYLYILNGFLGLLFFIFGFELLYETVSLVKSDNCLLETSILFAIIGVLLTIIIWKSHKSKDFSKYKLYSFIHCGVIIIYMLLTPILGINIYYEHENKSISTQEMCKMKVLEDANLYLRVDLSNNSTINSNWYPIDLKIPLETVKKDTIVFYTGEEFGDYYKITTNKKTGYVEQNSLLQID